MRDVLNLVGALFATIVVGVYGLITGDIDHREGVRRIVAALAALAVTVLMLRVLAWLAGDVVLHVVSRVVGAL